MALHPKRIQQRPWNMFFWTWRFPCRRVRNPVFLPFWIEIDGNSEFQRSEDLKNSDRNVLNVSWPIVWRWLPVGFRLPLWWPLGQVPQALEFYLCSLLWKSGWWYFKAFTVAVLRTGLTNAKISSKPYSSYRWCLETGKFGSHDDFRIHAFWWGALLSLGAGCCLKSLCCCPCW